MSLSAIILLILNIVLVVFVALGFVFGLRGAKKSGLCLAFFIVGLSLTLIITPLITDLILKINITIEGESISISQYVINLINEQPVIADLFNNGANIEQLIVNMPKLIGNLVVFTVLVYVVGFVFWIAYLIIGHFILRKKEPKNAISASAPANVSATGVVKYERKPLPEKKHRLLGGAIGAVHGLILLIATLFPVMGAVNMFNDIANAQETPPTTVQVSLTATEGTSQEEEQIKYTPTAKLIRENLPKEVLDITNAIGNSIIGNICEVADVGDIWFNNLAKCEVAGKKVVLKNEIANVANIYDNVEFLSSLDFSNVQDIKSIDFDKIRKAIGYVFDSSLLQALTPDIINGFIKWLDVEDIESLDPQIQEVVKPIYDEIKKDDDLETLFNELKEMFVDVETVMQTLEDEVLIVVDIAELVVKSDIIDELLKDTDEEDLDMQVVLNALKAEDYKLPYSLIDKIFESDFVNLGVLTGLNMGLEVADKMFKDLTEEQKQVDITKIDISTMTTTFETTALKDTAKVLIDVLSEYNQIGIEEIEKDQTKIVTENFDTNLQNIGIVLDDIYNMSVLNEFGTMTDIINALKACEITYKNSDDEDEILKFTDYIDFDALDEIGFTFEAEFINLKGIKPLLAKGITETVGEEQHTTALIMYILDGDVQKALEQLTDVEIDTIVECLTNSKLLQPLSVIVINELNKQIQEVIGGEVADLLPEDVDLSEQSEEISAVVSDVVTLLPELTDIQNGTQTLEDVIKNEEVQDTVVSLLENLETNAQGEGVFTDIYDAMVDYIKDDKNGLTDIANIIANNTTTNGTQTDIDWAQVIADYLASI